jgi:two-component system, cell cycle response regulator
VHPDTLERILSCEQLPTLPAVAMRVIELTANVNVKLDDLAETLQNDQGLSAKILKTVNSSFYGLRKPCSTINQALVMLGLSAVKSLALSFSLVQSVGSAKDGTFDFVPYWRRAIYTGVAAKLVAHRSVPALEDEAFLGGLLQDIGMVAMYRGLRGDYAKVLEAAGEDHRQLVKHEIAGVELQHPDIGAMLCQRWKLPEELIIPVKYHERPNAAPTAHADIVRAVGLGNLMHDALTHEDPAASVERLHARANEWFGIARPEADDLLRSVAQHAREMSSLFRLDTGEAANPDKILAKAAERTEELKSSAEAQAQMTGVESLVADTGTEDALTGVATRERGLRIAEEAFDKARNEGKSLSLLAISIDGLAHIVQTLGSEGSDVAVVEVALMLQDLLQPVGGSVCRWDAGLFIAVVPGLDRVEAVRSAGEIRAGVERAAATWLTRARRPVEVRVSVGVASLERAPAGRIVIPPFTKIQQLLTAAVRASEAAQQAGGNAVRAFTPRSTLAA